MRTRGDVFEYREERDQALLDAYHRELSLSKHPIVLREIFQKVVDSTSERFWVSPERATYVISELIRGNKLPRMNRNKRRMYMEIFKRVQKLRRQPDYEKKRLIALVQMVVESEAPSFYLTPQSAAVIMHHIRKRRRCKSAE